MQSSELFNDNALPSSAPVQVRPLQQLSIPSMSSSSSQPESSWKCEKCPRTFQTDRGRKQHQGKCISAPKKVVTISDLSKQCLQDLKTHVVVSSTSATLADRDTNRIVVQIVPRDPTVWGTHTAADLRQVVSAVYEEIVFWRKNVFMVPSGSAGKDYVSEMTRLINIWNANATDLHNISLKLLMIMPALLLQKPSFKSKAKQHSECLKRRFTQWQNGDFDSLVREARTIQSKLPKSKVTSSPDYLAKTFSKLMLQGKVHAALMLLEKEFSNGILNLTDEVI